MICFLEKEEKMIKFALRKLLLFSIPLVHSDRFFFVSVGECGEAQGWLLRNSGQNGHLIKMFTVGLKAILLTIMEEKVVMVKNPWALPKCSGSKKGVCFDSANFVIDALNRINPEYKARSVFIKNKLGPLIIGLLLSQWMASYFIMDYGTSEHWGAMRGIHGPYESLSEYQEFLSSLRIKGFFWWKM